MRPGLLVTTIVLLITLGLVPITIIADYRFDNWTTDDGLPQNTVSAILQTRNGYLWLATAGGLVRFDGLRFTVFDKSEMDGISATRQIIAADPQAQVMIVTNYDDADLREAARSVGACEYVVKQNLIEIRRILANRK